MRACAPARACYGCSSRWAGRRRKRRRHRPRSPSPTAQRSLQQLTVCPAVPSALDMCCSREWLVYVVPRPELKQRRGGGAANGGLEMEVDEEADPFGLGALPDDAAPAAPFAAPAQPPPLLLPPPDGQLADAGHAPAGPDLTSEAPDAVAEAMVPPRPAAGQAAERGSRERPDREGRSNRDADAAEPRSRGGRDEHHKERHRDGRSERDSRREREGDGGRREHKSSGKAHKSDRHGKDRKRERSDSGDEGRSKRDRPR